MKYNNILVKISVFAIRTIWQDSFGKWYDKRKGIICRFYPTCSEYTVLALEKHGFFKGWMLGYNRIRKCTRKNTESCIDYP